MIRPRALFSSAEKFKPVNHASPTARQTPSTDRQSDTWHLCLLMGRFKEQWLSTLTAYKIMRDGFQSPNVKAD